MTPTIAACAVLALGCLAYIFWPQRVQVARIQKSRLEFLRERREVVYENLRDLNFENKAGKLSPEDYAALSASLEDEAAVLLAEIDELQHAEWNEATTPSR
jgi:hypothetical protein